MNNIIKDPSLAAEGKSRRPHRGKAGGYPTPGGSDHNCHRKVPRTWGVKHVQYLRDNCIIANAGQYNPESVGQAAAKTALDL